MRVLVWLLLGLVVAGAALVYEHERRPRAALWTLLLGTAGALLGGLAGRTFVANEVPRPGSGAFAAMLGALVAVVIHHVVATSRPRRLMA